MMVMEAPPQMPKPPPLRAEPDELWCEVCAQGEWLYAAEQWHWRHGCERWDVNLGRCKASRVCVCSCNHQCGLDCDW